MDGSVLVMNNRKLRNYFESSLIFGDNSHQSQLFKSKHIILSFPNNYSPLSDQVTLLPLIFNSNLSIFKRLALVVTVNFSSQDYERPICGTTPNRFAKEWSQ